MGKGKGEWWGFVSWHDVLGSCELMPLEAMECHGMVGCCLYFFCAFYLLHF